MVLVKASADSEAGVMPSTELLAAMGAYNDELLKAGVLLAGDGLHPSSKAKRVRFSKKRLEVIDGPFAETNELVAGFWIWNVKSMDDAVSWAKRCPMGDEAPAVRSATSATHAYGELEIRPIFESEDFGAELTPALRAQEDRQRAEIEKRNNRTKR
jgi:hypothetical protein